MDVAFTDPMYKEARTLVNEGKTVKLTIEDLNDYDTLFAIKGMNEAYRRASFEEIVDKFDDLKLFVKYVYRTGFTITKVEVVE